MMRADTLIKHFRQAFQHWRYLGYDRDTIQRHGAETDRTNLRTLKRLCLFALSLIAVLAMFHGAILRQSECQIAVICASAFLVILYFYVSELLRGASTEPIRGTKSLVYLISVILYLSGILSGTVMAREELGVMSIWMFLLVQISFDIPPVQNALTVIPFAGLFLIISSQTKIPQRWHLDALYTLISVLVGLFISYHQAHLALDNIIAKSNLQKVNFALYHTATTDELTGLMNRRMVFDRYDAILSECAENRRSMACVVLDIDDYKQFNDSYGHPEGDELLRRIGQTLRDYSAQTGIDIGRIGGEEFLAVWPEEKIAHCEQVAEELRSAIERMDIPHASATDHARVTMSVGLCLLPGALAQSAYFYADKALYRAKDAGKNCSCRYDATAGVYRSVCSCGESEQPVKQA